MIRAIRRANGFSGVGCSVSCFFFDLDVPWAALYSIICRLISVSMFPLVATARVFRRELHILEGWGNPGLAPREGNCCILGWLE